MNIISNSSDRFTNFVTMNLQKISTKTNVVIYINSTVSWKFCKLVGYKNLMKPSDEIDVREFLLSCKPFWETSLLGDKHIFWTIFLTLFHCAQCGSSPRFWQINRNSIELGNWINLEFKQGISPLGSSQTIDWEGRRQCIFAQRNDLCCIKLNH